MSKPLSEAFDELHESVDQLKVQLWKRRWEILPYLVIAFVVVESLAVMGELVFR